VGVGQEVMYRHAAEGIRRWPTAFLLNYRSKLLHYVEATGGRLAREAMAGGPAFHTDGEPKAALSEPEYVQEDS
jgi:hypothetical protein